MATFAKRTYQTWRVKSEKSGVRQRTFPTEEAALTHARELADAGFSDAKVVAFTSTSWQVRIRTELVGELTKTFKTKAEASQWAKEREGEIAKREFVDYRTADQTTLGQLLQKYESKKLGDKPADHPDKSRVHKLCRHPITRFKMSVIQPSDFATYRDQRLKGEFVERTASGAEIRWDAVKGATVNKELELMARVIALARKEWHLHLARNPASGLLVKRVELTEADERDRRLHTEAMRENLVPSRDRRKSADDEFELDPETDELLAMSQTEQQLLLRAARYPEWFRPRKKVVTVATLRARKKAQEKPRIKTRLRRSAKVWPIISFAIETAMRRGEMLKLRWEYVYLKDGYLLLPGSITKNRKKRLVPLSLRAKRILQTRPRTSEFVFDTTKDTIKKGFERAKQRVNVEDLRVHDLRHEGTSRLFERTSLRSEEIGHITGHNDPRMLKRYYNMRPEEFVQRFQSSFVK
ncbi:site-specific integrase [Ramlibacter sp. G-1-2-2]|uniref:Site-specific integrase n=1 Tax=Ramlibacter agri TaxID=2728837 RepID=A0A848HAF5_9BURK|nr:site-specific integrase [Ramlibacter agri]NML48016.1 site-specific integrase [Ramlibacter agri]